MLSSTPHTARAKKTTGLRYWMLRVLEECDHAAEDFSPDPVHDLRVSLRRCRSLADGLYALDPDPNWKAMRKAGKRLFQRLGALRDIQIMMEWIENATSTEVATAEQTSVERPPLPALRPFQPNNESILNSADPAALTLLKSSPPANKNKSSKPTPL